jgi:hypothetical protein
MAIEQDLERSLIHRRSVHSDRRAGRADAAGIAAVYLAGHRRSLPFGLWMPPSCVDFAAGLSHWTQ